MSFGQRRFQANQVTDVNPSYYLQNNPDVLANYNQWSKDFSSLHFADYVRTNPEFSTEWNRVRNDLGDPRSRWEWASAHWDAGGTGGAIKPLVVGKREPWAGGNTRTIWTGKGYEDSSKNDFAAWHFDTFGRNEPGRYGTAQAFYDSPGETKKRDDAAAAALRIETDRLAEEDRIFKQRIEDERAAAMQKAAEGAEAGRLASMRGGGSRTLSASGAATFKGKGLTSSENKRGKGRGTGQLRRPYGASNLSIAATGKGNQQSTLNL